MVTKEKLKWLKDNRAQGDLKTIAENLQIGYQTAVQVLRGSHYGPHGDAIIDAATRLIEARHKRLRKEARKFAPAVTTGNF